MAKFCGKCGTPLDEETGLCPKCDKDKIEALKKENVVEEEKIVVKKQRFCNKCGTPLDENGLCPNCDKDKIETLEKDDVVEDEKIVVKKQLFCNKCGSTLDEETGLCPKCDRKKLNQLKNRIEDEQEEPKKKNKVFIIIGSLVIIAVIALATYFLLNTVFNKDTTVQENTNEVVEEVEENEEAEETTEDDSNEGLVINTYDYTVEVGEYVDIDMDDHGGYTIKSNDFDVVTVVGEQLYGVGAGETTVTITYHSQEYTLNVTVVNNSSNSSDATKTISMKSYEASSTLASQGSYNYKASNLFDEDSNTCWCEGVDGNGIGESITITFDDGTETITVDDSNSAKQYTFSNTHITDSVVITIKDVYEGTKYSDTCISKLQLNVLV